MGLNNVSIGEATQLTNKTIGVNFIQRERQSTCTFAKRSRETVRPPYINPFLFIFT